MVLWRKFDQFEPGSRFDQWAFRVARNQILYYRQKITRERLFFSQALMDRLAFRIPRPERLPLQCRRGQSASTRPAAS